jgi:hypothetical protein
MKELRFGPDPDRIDDHDKKRAIEQGNELARIIRETMDRMRHGLWFWKEEKA